MKTLCLGLTFVCTLSVAGCKKQKATSPASVPSPAPATSPAGGLSGTVLEIIDSAGYTYLRISTADGEKWAAVNQTKVAKGDRITVHDATLMKNFKSRTLNRQFDSIYFGTLGGGQVSPHGGDTAGAVPAGGGAPGPGGKAALAPAHGNLGAKVTLDAPIAKAAGPDGRTIADVYAQKEKLKDKSVSVRGKVTKFNANIMGKNWLHLQDGTGNAASKTFDLTATTKDQATVGDIVVVRGVIRVNKDFGAGYTYPVIVENSKLEK